MNQPPVDTATVAHLDAVADTWHDLQFGTHGEWRQACRRQRAALAAIVAALRDEHLTLLDLDALPGDAQAVAS